MTGTELATAIDWISSAFTDYKMLLERSIGFHNDALHVFVGFVLHIAIALVLRKSLASWLPWAIVLMLELGNEGSDLLQEIWPRPAMQLGEALKDVLLTIAIPTMLMIVVRWLPRLFRRP